MSDIAEDRYKSLLIVNESSDALVTLYLYPKWDFLCWISFESKIIKPNEKYLHRSSDSFKFKLVARFEDGHRSKETLQELKEWSEDKLLKITESLKISEERLEDFPGEKIVCLRKAQRDKELKSTSGRRNLYEILGLDMNQVRKMSKEDQIKAIKKGFHREIQRWHPDKNFGDDANVKEVLLAHEILKDEEKRARYHNEADYDKGWLSLKRFKAIFCPECVTKEQEEAFRHRMYMFALSLGIAIGGTVLTVCTGGLGAVAAVATGAVFGGGLIGAGLQSLQHTVSRKSVVDECDKKQWVIKAGIGFLGGAATGGAAVGITAGVAGLGSAAVESGALTMGQYIGIGAGSGAVGGAASSLAADAGRKFADGENVTLKQVVGHMVCGAVVGAAAGAAGGAVTKSVVGIEASAASANLQGEIGEQVAILTGARRLGKILAQNIPRTLTEKGSEAFMDSVFQFTEERLDDSVENRNPREHLVGVVQNVATSTVKGLAIESCSATASHAWNEIDVDKRVRRIKKEHSQQLITPLVDDDTGVVGPRVDSENGHITRGRVRRELSEENNDHRIKWRSHSKYSFSYQPLVSEEPSADDQGPTLRTIFKEDGVRDQSGDETVRHRTIVDHEDGVPAQSNACENNDHRIKWRSHSKYSFSYQPLVSEEPSADDQGPTLRTIFKEDGVRDQSGDETVRHRTIVDHEDGVPAQSNACDEPEDGKVKYISEGYWVSKMVVSYFLKGETITQEVRGSRTSITIPGNATRLKVKFQVRRPFWGDLKKYDRFKRCWCEPDQPHVFKFDTPPPLRTFTISGSLWYEAVMTVSNEYHDETKEM